MRVNTSRIVFMGTPQFAVPSLEALLKSGRQIPLVVTQPDRPAGRGNVLTPPPVKTYALEKNLHVIQPQKIKTSAFRSLLRDAASELFIVVAYGRILTSKILEIPKLTLNVHASLLPRWRGASPICRAIVQGDSQTGSSIMKLTEELDAGDVLLQEATPIHPLETMGELTTRLSYLGAESLIKALDLLDTGQARFTPQDPRFVTFAPPVKVEEARIDWKKTSAELINHVRGYHPWPGAFTYAGKERIKIFKALPFDISGTLIPLKSPGKLHTQDKKLLVSCGDGWIDITELQREGKSRQQGEQFLKGYRITEDTVWQ